MKTLEERINEHVSQHPFVDGRSLLRECLAALKAPGDVELEKLADDVEMFDAGLTTREQAAVGLRAAARRIASLEATVRDDERQFTRVLARIAALEAELSGRIDAAEIAARMLSKATMEGHTAQRELVVAREEAEKAKADLSEMRLHFQNACSVGRKHLATAVKAEADLVQAQKELTISEKAAAKSVAEHNETLEVYADAVKGRGVAQRRLADAERFLLKLAHGGWIVSSANLTPQEIVGATDGGRMLVTPDGLGFVYVDASEEMPRSASNYQMLSAVESLVALLCGASSVNIRGCAKWDGETLTIDGSRAERPGTVLRAQPIVATPIRSDCASIDVRNWTFECPSRTPDPAFETRRQRALDNLQYMRAGIDLESRSYAQRYLREFLESLPAPSAPATFRDMTAEQWCRIADEQAAYILRLQAAAQRGQAQDPAFEAERLASIELLVAFLGAVSPVDIAGCASWKNAMLVIDGRKANVRRLRVAPCSVGPYTENGSITVCNWDFERPGQVHDPAFEARKREVVGILREASMRWIHCDAKTSHLLTDVVLTFVGSCAAPAIPASRVVTEKDKCDAGFVRAVGRHVMFSEDAKAACRRAADLLDGGEGACIAELLSRFTASPVFRQCFQGKRRLGQSIRTQRTGWSAANCKTFTFRLPPRGASRRSRLRARYMPLDRNQQKHGPTPDALPRPAEPRHMADWIKEACQANRTIDAGNAWLAYGAEECERLRALVNEALETGREYGRAGYARAEAAEAALTTERAVSNETFVQQHDDIKALKEQLNGAWKQVAAACRQMVEVADDPYGTSSSILVGGKETRVIVTRDQAHVLRAALNAPAAKVETPRERCLGRVGTEQCASAPHHPGPCFTVPHVPSASKPAPARGYLLQLGERFLANFDTPTYDRDRAVVYRTRDAAAGERCGYKCDWRRARIVPADPPKYWVVRMHKNAAGNIYAADATGKWVCNGIKNALRFATQEQAALSEVGARNLAGVRGVYAKVKP